MRTRSTLVLLLVLGLAGSAWAGSHRTQAGLANAWQNSQLGKGARLARAADVLGVKIGGKKAGALLRAHGVGAGQLGRDGVRKAGVNADGTSNYTLAQIRTKARILREAGFTDAQIAKLFDHGIAGEGEARPYQKFDTMTLVKQLGVIDRFVRDANARISGRGGWIAWEANEAEIARAKREKAGIERELNLRK